MECRKWMHHHSALPMVVKVTRASGFLVTNPPKIASIGAKPANCLLYHDHLLHCFEEKTSRPLYME